MELSGSDGLFSTGGLQRRRGICVCKFQHGQICQVLSTLSDVGQPFSKPADQSRYYEYETAELRMEDVPVENLLCIVSDECSEGLEVADGQRKRTLDAIMKALGFELLEFAELEDLDHILSRDQKAAFYRAFDEFRCDFYGEEREFVIVLIKGENAPLLSETDIFVELDYFVISFEDFFIMIYPSETGFCDGYVEITYGIGFLSWNLIPLLQMLYGKLNGNVEEFFNRSVMEQEAQPL